GYCLQNFAFITDKPGCCVFDRHVSDCPNITARKVRDQYASDGPVHNVHPSGVARSDGEIRAIAIAGIEETNKIFRIMREVGVHFKDVVVVSGDRELKASNVCRTEFLLSCTLQ